MEPWLEITREGQCKTWLTLEIPEKDVKIIHYYGIPGGRKIQELDKFHERLRFNKYFSTIVYLIDKLIFFPLLFWIPRVAKSDLLSTNNLEIQCRVIDTLQTLRWKQLAAYRFIQDNFEFDFLYETNSSSYIIPRKILDIADGMPAGLIYAGNLPYPGANFASGANRLMSTKALNLILNKRHLWDTGFLEDVAIGKFFSKFGIAIQELPSVSLASKFEVLNLSRERIEKNYHFRLKSFENGKRIDSELMSLLDKIIKSG